MENQQQQNGRVRRNDGEDRPERNVRQRQNPQQNAQQNQQQQDPQQFPQQQNPQQIPQQQNLQQNPQQQNQQQNPQQQNQQQPREEPFKQRVPLEINNLSVVQVSIASRGRYLGPNTQIISMHEWATNGPTHNSVMVCQIVSISATSSQTQVQQQGYVGACGQMNNVRHSRRIVVVCLVSPTDHNTGVILQGNGLCMRAFEDVEIRDSGKLRPGCVIGLVNLPRSDRTLSDGNNPILVPTRPLIVLNSNLEFPERPVVTEGTSLNGFFLDGRVDVNGFRAVDTPCGSDLCDHQSLMNGDVMANRCACFQMKHRVGLAAIVLDILVTLPNGSTFTAQFCSKWFLKKMLFTGPFPAGTKAAHLEDYEVEDNIYNAAVAVTSYINNNAGGFLISGWTKRGLVQDQAVDQPGNGLPHNVQRVQVESGTLNYHVTRLDPMRPEAIDLDVLQAMKVDIATGLRPSM